MIKILLVTSEKAPFSKFSEILKEKDDVELTWKSLGQTALEAISKNPVDLAVINETISDMTGIEFMKKLLPINPMINCALVSSLAPEEFHEASEGFGVLMQLSVKPGASEAKDLLKRLKHLKNHAAG